MTDQQFTLDILEQVGDVTPRIDPAVLEEARRMRAYEAAEKTANPRPLPASGYTLWAEMVAATIQGDHIEVALRVHGQVQRPEALATASGAVLNLKVPAKVDRRCLETPNGKEGKGQ